MSHKLKSMKVTNDLLEHHIDVYDRLRKPLSSIERKGKKTYPYYGATGVLDYVSDYIFDDEYILLAEDGTVMNPDDTPIIQFISGKTWVGNHTHVLKSKGDLSLYALYFILRETNVRNAVTGAVQMKINQENMKKINIKSPVNIEEFNNISFIVMEKIKSTNNQLTSLENLKQQYLKKFFG